jgi:hypothetical protein
MKRIMSVRKQIVDYQKVVLFSALTFSYINIKADHELRPDVYLSNWFGMAISEKTFLAVANTLLLNSFLFLGEIV